MLVTEFFFPKKFCGYEKTVYLCTSYVPQRGDINLLRDFEKKCKENRKVKNFDYLCNFKNRKLGFLFSCIRAYNFNDVKRMIVKKIVNQVFTDPFKTKGNLRNVQLKEFENVVRQ